MLDIWELHRIRRVFIGYLVLVFVIGGCASSLPQLPAPTERSPLPLSGVGEEQRQTPPLEYTLGPGDVLRVSVYDNPDLSQEVTIGADGAFSYPLIGRVQAAGLPVRQLESLLAQRFADGYLVSPQVGVTVTQHKSQLVYVMGAVKTPGSYPLQRQTTLLEILSAAGGPTPEAGSEVVLTHATDKHALPSSIGRGSAVTNGQPAMRVSLEQLMAGGVPQRISLQDGDVIYVPLAAFVYVTGEIQRPGRYRLENDTTIQKAVTLAGGFTKFAATKSMTVQRVINGKRQAFQAGLNDLLQAEDVIVVHPSLF
jgi:polysaccharide export outer membrane protein